MGYSYTIIGFVFGLFSSITASVIWYKIFVPKIEFTNKICRYKSTTKNEEYTYKIKFRNAGKRDIYEMNLYCILFIPGLKLRNNIHTVDINLSYNFKPVFKRRGKKTTNPDGLVRICLNDKITKKEFTRPLYSEQLIAKAYKKNLTLEDLLTINENVYIKFYIIGLDKFSGSKRIFESQKYTSGDIYIGSYKKDELYIN